MPASGTRTAWPCPPSISPSPKFPPCTQLIVEPFRQCGQDVAVDERGDDQVTRRQPVDVGADLLDNADELVADRADRVRALPPEVPQVGPAHAGQHDAHDRVRRRFDDRVKALADLDDTGPAEDSGFHLRQLLLLNASVSPRRVGLAGGAPSLTAAHSTNDRASAKGITTLISHRSGETEDRAIVHFGVARGCSLILLILRLSGAPVRVRAHEPAEVETVGNGTRSSHVGAAQVRPCATPGRWILLGLELIVVLGVAVLGCSILARRLRVAPPILLLACGALLG